MGLEARHSQLVSTLTQYIAVSSRQFEDFALNSGSVITLVHHQHTAGASAARPNLRHLAKEMKIAIISARYTDEYNLDEFFTRVFGYGNASVTVRLFAFFRVRQLTGKSIAISREIPVCITTRTDPCKDPSLATITEVWGTDLQKTELDLMKETVGFEHYREV